MKTIMLTFLLTICIQAQTTQWRLVWDANPVEDNVLFYTVYRSTDNINFVKLEDVQDTSFIDTPIRGINHYYYVTASNQYGESNPSVTVFESIPLVSPIANQIINYGEQFDQLILSVVEPDGDLITWSFEISDPNILIAPNGIITYNEGWYGTVNVTAKASDNSDPKFAFYDIATFFLTVNAPPIPEEVDSIWFESVD